MNIVVKTYRFEPKEDITAYELAIIIGVFGAKMLEGISRYVRWPEESMGSDDCIFRRHFTEASDSWESRGY